jgi:trimeric autotransporter adhesin
MTAVTNGGVCGPVVFNIDNDTYSGAHRLGKINGASAVNTVTFQGTTTDSSLVVLTDVAPTGFSYPGNGALELNGASYVTFKKLTVSMTASGTAYYAHGVLFKGGSHHNNFISCAMRTAALYGGALFSNTDNDSNNTFDKVYFWGGYYGVYFGNGSYSSTNQENNNVWTKCWTDSNTYYGFYLNGEGNYTITQSKMINLTNKYAGGYGIFGYYNNGVTITRNYIHNTTGGGYGIYGYYMVGSKVDSSYIMNNMISIENPNSVTGYGTSGLYLYYSDYLNVYNNSVNAKTGASNEYGMYFYNYSTASQFNIVNNCLVTGAGVPLAISSTSAISYSDHNNLFDFGAGNVGSISGSISTSLTSWRSATSGWDTNSVAINPSYRNDSDLHAKSAGINGKAAVRTDVKIDIDGDVRSSSTPDIGADEFTPIGDDASANRIVSPSASACGDSNVKIIAEVGNVGLNTITSMPVKYYVYNALTGAVVDSGVQTYSRSLASGSNDTFTLKYAWNTYTGGSFKIKVVTNLAKDGDHTNDSAVSYVTYYPHFGNPTALGASSCGGSSTLSLIATPAKTGDKLFWYDATGALVNKGDTFKTSVTKTTTFYVQAKGDTSNEGADYSTMGGSFSNYSYTNAYLEFDAKRNIVIDSVDVYASTSGTVTVTIKDASGTTLGSTTSTVSGTGSAERIPVKVTVPMGTAYRMYRGGSATLAYNYNFTSPYVPYPFSGKNVDVTASYLGTFSYKYYYWYFYNWVVTDTNACASKLIPVVATVGTGGKPTASFTKSHLCANDSAMFTDNSTIASGSISGGTIAFGDGSTGAIKTAGGSVYHKYAKAGTYKVTFSAVGSGGCTDDTTIAVVISRAPSAGFSTSKVCEGDSASFVDTTTITGSVKRTWYFDGVKSTSTSQITKNAFATGGGAHTASIVITSAGCTDSVTRTIAVNPTPIAKFMVDSATLCKSGAIGFIADTTKSTGSTYSWNFGDASAAGSGQSTTHTYASNGTYTASLTATSAAGCVSKNLASMSVIVTPAPTAAFKFNVKAGYAVDFMATDTTGTTNTYAWDFGDLNSGSGKTVSHTYASKAVYVAKLSISNVNKCATSDTHSVNLTPIIEQSNAPFGLGVAPNPFRDNTVITYTLSSTEKVTITVTDLLGRVMANVTSAVQNAGQYRVELSATDNNMSAGMYLIRFVAGNKVVVKQIEAVR